MKTSEQLRKELYQHIYEMQEKQQKLDVDHIQTQQKTISFCTLERYLA